MFGSKSRGELQVPTSAQSDKNARELVRAWAAHGGLHCSCNVNNWGDNERVAWGVLLTDIVRHVADAMHELKEWDTEETIREIRRVFDAEFDAPTAEPSGEFLKQ